VGPRLSRLLRWGVALALIGVGAVAAIVSLYESGRIRFNYPSQERFPVRGIDVSHHQGEIDWDAVRSAGIEFVFVKATEGRDHNDTRFLENWEGAGRAGIRRGAYHFFTFCTPGLEQADHFLSVVGSLPRELPVAADVEFSGNCEGWSSIDDIRSELRAFLRRVGDSLGHAPTLYVTPSSFREIAAGHFDRRRIWLRGLFFEPSRRRYGAWSFWQYADNARLPGIRGPVDLNVFCCSRAEFLALPSLE
jgi:lysozyme